MLLYATQVIENEDGLRQALADSINEYCTQHAEECCEALSLVLEE